METKADSLSLSLFSSARVSRLSLSEREKTEAKLKRKKNSVLLKVLVPRRLGVLQRLLLPFQPALADAAPQREPRRVGKLPVGPGSSDQLRSGSPDVCRPRVRKTEKRRVPCLGRERGPSQRERVVVQPIVDQHRDLGRAGVLPVEVDAARRDVVGRQFDAVVLGEDRELDAAAPVLWVEDPGGILAGVLAWCFVVGRKREREKERERERERERAREREREKKREREREKKREKEKNS